MAEGRARRVSALAEGLRVLDAVEVTAIGDAVDTLERVVQQLSRAR
jgi:hypothetical protein